MKNPLFWVGIATISLSVMSGAVWNEHSLGMRVITSMMLCAGCLVCWFYSQ